MNREQALLNAIAKKRSNDEALWVDAVRLAQHFDLSMPQLTKRLHDMGLKNGRAPSYKAIQGHIARLKPQIRGRASAKVQWHLVRAGAEIEQTGLVPLDEFALFCRINGDMAKAGLHTVTDENLPQAAHNWFITHQISLQMDAVPGGRKDDFVDDLVQRLVSPARGPSTPVELVYAMLEVLGHLNRHLARKSAAILGQDTAACEAEHTLQRL